MALLGVACLSGRAAARAPDAEADVAPQVAEGSEAPALVSDEKSACIAAFDQAQRDRAASRLVEGQKQALACSRPGCGNALMNECTQLYTELERALPSIVLAAHDEASNVDLTAVDVTLDGQPFVQSLDGRPIPLDPGEYELTFSVPGEPAISRRVVIVTGDKYRLIHVVFATTPPAAPASAPPAAAVELAAEASVPAMTYVLGGLGVIGLGTFAALRIISDNDFDTLKQTCAPACPASDVANLRQKYVFSNVALGVGAGAVVGAVLWYTLGGGTSASGKATTDVSLVPARGGAVATARGRF